MSLFRDNYNATASNIEKVTEVILSIWNPDDILKGSVCEVFTQDTYENNMPKPNGLFDPRMGTIENGQVCETCKMDNRNCTGHFGHIRLARPVYYIQFMTMVLKVLKCVCWRCSISCHLCPKSLLLRHHFLGHSWLFLAMLQKA